ncbi:MAG: hypothetical protein ACR2K5_07765 [Pseudolabrys sp.]
MTSVPVDFDAPDLAARVEKLTAAERDALPFGVIELDRDAKVVVYNATETRLSGYGTPLGQNFFAVSRNPNKGELQARVMRAMEEGGPVDLEFGWRGGAGVQERELRLRVMSASRGGVWIFIERDDDAAA